MTENEIAKMSVDAVFTVHTSLVQVCWSQSTKQSWSMNLQREG